MIRNRLIAAGVAAAFAGTGMALSLPAGAQGLEEIVVTARKVEETLQDAPVSVSAFSELAIQNLNILSVDDIARFTPGLSTSAYVGRRGDRPVIRGQSNVLAGVQFGVESGTAYFVDGVYWPGSIASLDMNSIARVEVIKGPQSALYGRNTYAGAINFVSRDPSNEFEGRASATAGRHDEYEATLSLSAPLIEDQLFFSVNGRLYEYGGEYYNQATGNKVGQERTKAISAVLTWQPNDAVQLRLRSAFGKDRDGFTPIFLWNSDQNNCAPGFRSNFYYRDFGALLTGQGLQYGTNENQYFCGTIPSRPDLIDLDPNQVPLVGFERYQWMNSLALDMDLWDTGYTLTLQGAYRTERDRYGFDSDFQSAPINIITTQQKNLVDDYSVELRLASPQDEPLRWLAGVFLYDQDNDEIRITAANPFGVGLEPEIITGTRNQALFGLVEYDFSDAITGTLEARYAEERKDRIDPAFQGERTFYSFTPRATLAWQLNPDLNLYGIVARGNKPGGLNGAQGAPSGRATYEEETSTNFEFGAKTVWLDGRMTANVAAYYTRAKDVQLTTAVGTPDGSSTTSIATNQGSAEIWGLELEVQAALTDNLIVGASYGWSRPRFTEGCDDFEYTLNSGGFLIPPIDQLTPAQRELCSIKGNRLPLSSEHQATLNARFTQEIGRGFEWFVSGDLTYESSKFVQVHNRAKVGAATLLGMQLGIESDTLRISIYGRNLLDEDSVVNATRWGDLRYNGIPVPPGIFNRAPAEVDGQAVDRGFLGPRAFFTTLRRGPSYGIQATWRF